MERGYVGAVRLLTDIGRGRAVARLGGHRRDGIRRIVMRIRHRIGRNNNVCQTGGVAAIGRMEDLIRRQRGALGSADAFAAVNKEDALFGGRALGARERIAGNAFDADEDLMAVDAEHE